MTAATVRGSGKGRESGQGRRGVDVPACSVAGWHDNALEFWWALIKSALNGEPELGKSLQLSSLLALGSCQGLKPSESRVVSVHYELWTKKVVTVVLDEVD